MNHPVDPAARRFFLAHAVAIPLVAGVSRVWAQPTGRVPWIAYVRAETPPTADKEAFLQGLQEYGYADGTTVLVEFHSANGNEQKLRRLMAELVRKKVDLIVTSAPAATQAAKDATTTIPIVMVLVADPVAFGFINSLGRPGGNITGFAFLHPELNGKWLELLKESVPNLSRAAVLWNARNPYKSFDLKEMQRVADALKLTIESLPVRTVADFATAFEIARENGAGGMITLDDPFIIAHAKHIADLALRHRFATVHGVMPLVLAGGLMAYGPDRLVQNRRAAIYVDRILRGAKPAELPVEQPTKFELVLNMRTARALGIAFPNSVLVRADRVME